MEELRIRLLKALAKTDKWKTIADIYSEINMSIATAYMYLEDMEDKNEVGCKLKNNRAYWSITAVGRRMLGDSK